jgi:hypothetical protein
MLTVIVAILIICAIGTLAQIIHAMAFPLTVFALTCATPYIAYQIFAFFYFRCEKFKALKQSIKSHTQNCNDLNEHIEELKQFYIDIQSYDYGEGQLQDDSTFNFKRAEWTKTAKHSQTHNCSASVCKNANDQPFKYLCKYFDIPTNEGSLSRFEATLNNFSAAEQGKVLLQDEKEQILKGIAESIPYPIIKLSRERLTKNLGFASIDLSSLYFPVYTFQYVSAGGNSSMRSKIRLDLGNLEGLINYLNGLVKFRNSAAGQRALMTRALREEVKARDGYACRCCGISIDDERNLLLEIDHIIPISKGGKTTGSNLQTLCWRCNRSKGAKIAENLATEIAEIA